MSNNESHDASLIRDQFEDQWTSTDPDPPSVIEAIRAVTSWTDDYHAELVEDLVGMDLEWRWRMRDKGRRGHMRLSERPRVEDYIRLMPDAFGDKQQRLALIVTEYHTRHAYGDCPSIEEFAGRFPEFADEFPNVFPRFRPASVTVPVIEILSGVRQRASRMPLEDVVIAGRQAQDESNPPSVTRYNREYPKIVVAPRSALHISRNQVKLQRTATKKILVQNIGRRDIYLKLIDSPTTDDSTVITTVVRSNDFEQFTPRFLLLFETVYLRIGSSK